MSPRSGRKNLAQGKLNELKRRPGFRQKRNSKPALAGDRSFYEPIVCRPLTRAQGGIRDFTQGFARRARYTLG